MGSMAGNAMAQPVIAGFSRNFSPILARDPYTALRRPNYMAFGPNQQFYQPIYQPSYSQFSPANYGPAPFGGFNQQPMMGFGQRFGQPQRSLNDLSNFDMTGQGVFRNNPMPRNMMPPEMFGPATDISDQGQAALRQMPQPMQSQYRPIPFMNQTQIDAKAAADAAAAAPVNMGFSGDGAKAGGKVHEEGIDSLLKK